MASPRYSQISLEQTPWYHVVSRCVRRAFLCGVDHITGQSYEHRRGWVESRIKQLASIFTIDVASYAVMDNHYHIVVRVDNERVVNLSTQEVVDRWTQLYTGPLIIQRYLSEQRKEMSKGELLQVDKLADTYRQRLCDLSWFMKNLNEHIARRANAEEDVRGHFWESRYKCQALLDEKALLAAMAYVDLNPIRAAMSETPEGSEHTSIQQRIRELQGVQECSDTGSLEKGQPREKESGKQHPSDFKNVRQAPLMAFDVAEILGASIPFAFADYLDLVDTVGRAVHPARRGYIPEKTPVILQRLNIEMEAFVEHSNQFLRRFGNNAGSPAKLINLAAARNARFLRGVAKARELFGGSIDTRSSG